MVKFCRYMRQSVGTLLVTIGVCVLVAVLTFSWAFLNPIARALDAIAFTDNYLYTENLREGDLDYCQDVAFVNMSGVHSRLEIAEGLDYIAKFGPRVVAMDCIFSHNISSDSIENDSLRNVIARIPNFVSAQRIVKMGDSLAVEQSFYHDVCYNASVNIEDGIVRHFSPDSVTISTGGENGYSLTLPSFVGEILRLGYPDKYKMLQERGNDEELINYKKMQVDVYDMRKILDMELFLDSFDVNDRIILVGDIDDLRDYHTIATELYGMRRINGTLIHAYSIATATKEHRLITNMSTGWAIFWGLLITLAFNYFCCWAYEAYEKTNGMIINFTQLGFLLGMMLLGGLTFINFRYNLNYTYAMIGVGLGGFSSELWLWFESLAPYQWLAKKWKWLSL